MEYQDVDVVLEREAVEPRVVVVAREEQLDPVARDRLEEHERCLVGIVLVAVGPAVGSNVYSAEVEGERVLAVGEPVVSQVLAQAIWHKHLPAPVEHPLGKAVVEVVGVEPDARCVAVEGVAGMSDAHEVHGVGQGFDYLGRYLPLPVVVHGPPGHIEPEGACRSLDQVSHVVELNKEDSLLDNGVPDRLDGVPHHVLVQQLQRVVRQVPPRPSYVEEASLVGASRGQDHGIDLEEGILALLFVYGRWGVGPEQFS